MPLAVLFLFYEQRELPTRHRNTHSRRVADITVECNKSYIITQRGSSECEYMLTECCEAFSLLLLLVISTPFYFDVYISHTSQTWWEQEIWNSCDADGAVDGEHPSSEVLDLFHGHLLFFLNLTSRGRVTDRWLLQLAARSEKDDDDRPDPRLPVES